jgi:hypothetical protein
LYFDNEYDKYFQVFSGLTGKYPAIAALQGGVKRYNIKETPCRKAPPFRAESFTKEVGEWLPIKSFF